MKLRTTHTFAILEISPLAYAEIASALREAEYNHCFVEDGIIDMHGIGLEEKDAKPRFAVHYKLGEEDKLGIVTSEPAWIRATVADLHEVAVEEISIVQLERIDDK